MINTFFTSDHHFGHKNILEYEKDARPFETVEEMNEVLIDRWNSVVRSQDIVYHLGDFAFGKENIKIAERLHGKKRLIMGNHDTYPAADYLQYFDRLHGAVYWKGCILTHMPIHIHNSRDHLQGYGIDSKIYLSVHGHLHSKNITEIINVAPEVQGYPMLRQVIDKRYFNVSVEQNDLTPIHADVILQRLKEIS
jgi:calcineurin-like phosphoesterase family protein